MIKKICFPIILGTVLLLGVSCSSDDDASTVEPETKLTIDDIIGEWEAEGYRWELEEGESTCYLMTEDGNDFQYDENGDYISITIGEYCEQYAEDYNADPDNEIEGTAEDFAIHEYEGTYLFTTFEVTEEEITIYTGQSIPEEGTLAVLTVQGEYQYDEETETLTVQDVAIESDPREIEIKVFKDDENRLNFNYTDFDIITAYSYDETESYWVYAPMTFFTVPGEAYEPNEETQTAKRLRP